MDSWAPTPRQTEFLAANEDEVLYGGAAGGGKSDALIVDAMGLQQHALANSRYRALLIRQTFPELRELLDRTHLIYPNVAPGAKYMDRPWTEWRFPSGAKIILSSCDREQDVYKFQGQEFQWIGIDELGHYPRPFVWEYLTSRLRTSDRDLRCYMRATCNPGPKWIQDRWGIPDSGDANKQTFEVKLDDGSIVIKKLRFIPARLRDNPYLGPQYEANLQRLPKAERAALLDGRWGVVDVPGAIYADVLNQAREEKRICGVPYDRAATVDTHWDIGNGAQLALWCTQRVGREWHIIDYYSGKGQSATDPDRDKFASDHVDWLKTRGYAYGYHYLPHDAEAHEKGTGLTFVEVLEAHKLTNIRITPRISVEDGIQAARMLFNQCWFDAVKCAEGLNCLQFYRREWKERGAQFTHPVADWAAHGADAFRYFAVNSKDDPGELKLPPLKYGWKPS